MFCAFLCPRPETGETPFKRSIESPSAWMSPWFFNSFLPGPRIDTEISIEVIIQIVWVNLQLDEKFLVNELFSPFGQIVVCLCLL